MKQYSQYQRGFIHHVILLLFLVVFAIAGVAYLVSSSAASHSAALDISDDKCGVLSSGKRYTNGIVSVTGTYGEFGHNRCLREEVSHFSHYSLYIPVNYHSPHCDATKGLGDPYACGVASAKDATSYANSRGVHASTWWIDVEHNDKVIWDRSTADHVAYLSGLYDQLSQGHYGIRTVGFYSTPYMWHDIVGNTSFGSYSPTWIATGVTSSSRPSNLEQQCQQRPFTRHKNVLIQYKSTHVIPGNVIDVDVQC